MRPESTLIEEGVIIKQVEKICLSKEFKSKELLCRFLSYIVSEHLGGRDHNLKGYNIGIDVFGRGEDFDPGQDALVRIHAGRLRRILDLYYLKEGKNDEIRIEIPKGAYNPKININKNQISDGQQSVKTKDSTYSKLEPKVAILPFLNLTGDAGYDYFAQGISTELSVEVTKYEDLSVYNFISQYKKEIPLTNYKKQAKKRGVRFIIEGALNKSGKQFKILAQLTDLEEDKQIWAESYSKELTLDNLFEIQETISKEIAAKVASEYGVILQKLSNDSRLIDITGMDTYHAMLLFYYFEIHQTIETFHQAFNALNSAVKNDPESGIALALLAAMHSHICMLDLPEAEKSRELLGILAEKAHKLAPENLLVKTMLAVKCFAFNEKVRFFYLAEKCLSINKNSSFRTGALAFYLSLYGRWEQGKELLDEIMDKNIGYPLYFHGSTMLYYYRLNKYTEALTEANKYNLPTVFWAPMLRAAVYGQLNRVEEAEINIEHLKKLRPDFEEKAVYLISRYVKEDDLVNHILEGLRKARMKV